MWYEHMWQIMVLHFRRPCSLPCCCLETQPECEGDKAILLGSLKGGGPGAEQTTR